MDLTIPTVPLGVLTLLAFFSPYATAALNGLLSFVTNAAARRIVSIVFVLLLTAVVLVFYYAMTGEAIASWWVFALVAIGVAQAAYGLLFKGQAKKVEAAAEPKVKITE